MSRLVVVFACFDVALHGRLNAQVNVFRKALDELKAFGQGGAALELENDQPCCCKYRRLCRRQ